MTREEMEELADRMGVRVPVLDNGQSNFDSAIVGYVDVPGAFRVIYDYEKCIQSLMDNDKMTREDAKKYFEFNIVRALPYMGVLHPLILHTEL